MSKSTGCIIVLLIILSGLSKGAGDLANNILLHGDLETFNLTGQTGWTLGSSTYVKRINTDSSGAGTYCLELSPTIGQVWKASATNSWYPAERNTLYKLYADYKTSSGYNFSSGTFLKLRFYRQKNAGSEIEPVVGQWLSISQPSASWTTVSTGWLKCPPDATWMDVIVGAGVDGNFNGTFWLDNVIVNKVPDINDVTITVEPNQSLCNNFMGFGAQGDYFLTCSPNTSRGVGPTDIQLINDRIAAMRPHVIRTFFSYKWWEPVEGVQTPNNEFIQDYVRWCTFLQSIGCKVMLCPWGDYFAYSDWMNSNGGRLPAPDKRQAMVRSLVDFIRYLRVEQGLTNVYYITLMNEPDNSSRCPAVSDFVQMYQMLQAELVNQGLRSDIFLVGVDGSNWPATSPGEWFYEVVEHGGIADCDGATCHTYGYALNMTPLSAPFNTWLGTRKTVLDNQAFPMRRKSLMVAEFNTYGTTYNSLDNNYYEHGLFLTDFCIQALNEQAEMVLMWALFDTFYVPTLKQEYGLWHYKCAINPATLEQGPDYKWETWDPSWQAWEPRPGFYTWSLINRYTKPGSRVVSVNLQPQSDLIKAAALISPQGELSILMLNRYIKDTNVKLSTGLDRNVVLQCYKYTNGAIPTADRGMLQMSQSFEVAKGATFDLNLPSQSFVLLTDSEYGCPAGDIDRNLHIDFMDYAQLAGHWLYIECSESNWWCGGSDINKNGSVNHGDLKNQGGNWLK